MVKKTIVAIVAIVILAAVVVTSASMLRFRHHHHFYYPYYYYPSYTYPVYYPNYPTAYQSAASEGQLCGVVDSKQYGCQSGLVCDYNQTKISGIGICSRTTPGTYPTTTYPTATTTYPSYPGTMYRSY